MRDILDDDEHKVKPLSMLMLTTAGILAAMITYNAVFGQSGLSRAGTEVSMASGTTHVEVAAPAEVSNTVVFKYDATVEEVQRELLATGHFKGLVDGVNGQKTKIAIQHYQQDNGLPITGDITPEIISHIRYTKKLKAAAEYTGSIEPAAPVQQQAASPVAALAAVKKLNINKVAIVQKALTIKGYDVGPLTGAMNDATHAAILQFEMDTGLGMDGVIDAPLMAALSTANAGQMANDN